MPIRGHSGVQGGAEMGSLHDGVPGRRTRSTPTTRPGSKGTLRLRGNGARPGLTAEEDGPRGRPTARSTSCTRAEATSSTCCRIPAERSPTALGSVGPLQVRQDIVVTQPDARRNGGEAVVLLPGVPHVTFRRGGGTSTTTERRVSVQPRDRWTACR